MLLLWENLSHASSSTCMGSTAISSEAFPGRSPAALRGWADPLGFPSGPSLQQDVEPLTAQHSPCEERTAYKGPGCSLAEAPSSLQTPRPGWLHPCPKPLACVFCPDLTSEMMAEIAGFFVSFQSCCQRAVKLWGHRFLSLSLSLHICKKRPLVSVSCLLRRLLYIFFLPFYFSSDRD